MSWVPGFRLDLVVLRCLILIEIPWFCSHGMGDAELPRCERRMILPTMLHRC